MSSLGKLKKNAEAYRINQFYNNMTPEQYREGIRLAVKNSTETLAREYDRNLQKIQEEANLHIKESVRLAIDTISVELLYELADQLECFVDNPEFLDQKIDKVQNIYESTMKAIGKYANYKKESQARKEFLKKQKKVEKMFNIKF